MQELRKPVYCPKKGRQPHHFLLKTGLGFAGLLASTDFDGNYILAGAFGGDNALKIGDDLSIGFVYRF